MDSVWLNYQDGVGFSIRNARPVRYWLVMRKTIYDISLDPEAPLTWRDADGYRYRIGKECVMPYTSDLASVPLSMRPFLPHDLYPRSAIYHDYLCVKGVLFRCARSGEPWEMVEFSRRDSDRLFREMVKAEQLVIDYERAFDPTIMYAGVRIGSLWQGKTDPSGAIPW